jgi:uncharacterized protein YjbI with pentapeptide repeats
VRLQPQNVRRTLKAVITFGILITGVVLAQGESLETDMEKGPCQILRVVDWQNPELNVFWSCADLRGANLSGAAMMDAYLTWADLTGADLRGVDLSYGDLTGANFTGADLEGANLHLVAAMLTDFTRANLIGANFHDANMTGAILTYAVFDDSTVWPHSSFDPTTKGAININAHIAD